MIQARALVKSFDGFTALYELNLSVPKGARDLVTDERVGGLFSEETLTLRLEPGEMRSYSAPEGTPRLLDTKN